MMTSEIRMLRIGIYEIPAGIEDNKSADHDADRRKRIADNVQIGSPDIEAGCGCVCSGRTRR